MTRDPQKIETALMVILAIMLIIAAVLIYIGSGALA